MKKIIWSLASIVVVLSLTGCCCCCCTTNERTYQVVRQINAGPIRRESIDLDRQQAERVELTMQFAGGKLELGSDDKVALMSGEFTYNIDELAPLIEYTVVNGVGKLNMRHQGDQAEVKRLSEEVRNEWDVRLTSKIPFDLNVDVGASTGQLELGGLRLTNLKIDAGAADLKISFERPNPVELEAMIVRSGAARLEFTGLSNANLSQLSFDGGVGTYEFDLSGDWQRSATVQIKSGVSRIVLHLPRKIGVRICPGDLKNGDYGNLSQQNGCYVNDLYQQANLKLDIELDVGMSSVKVK